MPSKFFKKQLLGVIGKIKNGGDVDPLSPPVTANLQLFLSASSLTAADGDPIQTWPDLSGNNRNATQGALAARPLYKPNVINGRPVLRFDGINDGMALTSAITSNPATVYVVQFTTDTKYIVFHENSQSEVFYVAFQGSTATNVYANTGTPTSYRNGVLQTWANRGEVYTALNGNPYIVSVVSADFSLWTLGFRIANYLSFEYAGDLAAILIYSGAHSTADRTAVENWLKEVYGL